MKIQESAENYLEAILILNKRNGEVHAIDIAAELEFSKPSVSVAMKRLRENGYVEVNGMGHITLTDKGMEIAQRMYEPHLPVQLVGLHRRGPGDRGGGRLPHGACHQRRDLRRHPRLRRPKRVIQIREQRGSPGLRRGSF